MLKQICSLLLLAGSLAIGYPLHAQEDYTPREVPPVVNSGNTGIETMAFVNWVLSFHYDWAVAPSWTVGGGVFGQGQLLSQHIAKYTLKPDFGLGFDIRGRWYFDRSYRVAKGYSLFLNSGFFIEPSFKLLYGFNATEESLGENPFEKATVKTLRDYTTQYGIYPSLSVGYQYTTRHQVYFGAKLGLTGAIAVGSIKSPFLQAPPKPIVRHSLSPLIEFRIGFAFSVLPRRAYYRHHRYQKPYPYTQRDGYYRGYRR